jgi:Calcineurin-like phosphoesterase
VAHRSRATDTCRATLYTILHISDLHRSAAEPVTNETLVSSLLADRDRYIIETPDIPHPDAAIVTGDIIQGAKLGDPNWKGEVMAQYIVAHDFLALLADRMFDGDRRRVVVLPGNHDVCWNTARSAMQLVDRGSEPEGIPGILFQPNSAFRWSWKDRSVFRIDNAMLYNERLAAYRSFVERFYDGISLPHTLSQDQGFNLFELADGRIIVAAFESVHRNDCFGYQGAIDNAAIGRCNLHLRTFTRPWQLRIAAWHHNTSGSAGSSDFMDIQSVYEMIGHGFRLGLHGHQHLAEVNAHYINLPEQEKMAVVSAGSLCAGSRELPRGTNRQYNVIVLNENLSGARVHVREMQQGNHFGRCMRGAFAVSGFVDLEWGPPRDALGREVDLVVAREREVIGRAEILLRQGDPERAHQLLADVSTPRGSFARSLRLEVARKASKWRDLLSLAQVPESADELVHVVEAHLELSQTSAASDVLAKHADRLKLATHVRSALETRIDLRGALRQ